MDAEDAWRTLFAAPLEDFVKERDRLARELKAAGQADAAAALKKAKKPSLPLWAVNQVARHERALVEELLEAGAALAHVHQALAHGKASADFKGSSASYRQAIAAVVAAARTALEGAGHGADAGALRRIERSLEALPFAEPERREALRAGRLDQELTRDDAGGGLALEAALMASTAPGGASAAPPKAAHPRPVLTVVRSPAPTKADADAEAARVRARQRREEARARRAEADHAARAAAKAEQAARDRGEELARARKHLDDTHAAVAAAEARLAAERERAEAARRKIRELESASAAAARQAADEARVARDAEAVARQAEGLVDEA